MRVPDCLASLVDHGVLDDVIRPLMSGKEAQVYLVVSGGEERVAKVYKQAQNRSFQARAEYTEGRKVRNTRDQRAMHNRSRYGRAQDEAAWRSTEVDMIYRLRDAGVRVPEPYQFIDGVLIMELVRGRDGNPAPRLGDLTFSPDEATRVFKQLLAEVVRMLFVGVVHGDLSDFNVLMASDGPVIIDFPQAVNAAGNQNARKLLLRDVDNLHRFIERFAPGRRAVSYAQEAWQLYERGVLTPTTELTGRYVEAARHAGTDVVLDLIADAAYDERQRRQTLGLSMRGASSSDFGRGHARRGQGVRAGEQGRPVQGRPVQGGERVAQKRDPSPAAARPTGGRDGGHPQGQGAADAKRRPRHRRGRR
jgi:RIO kinase 1